MFGWWMTCLVGEWHVWLVNDMFGWWMTCLVGEWHGYWWNCQLTLSWSKLSFNIDFAKPHPWTIYFVCFCRWLCVYRDGYLIQVKQEWKADPVLKPDFFILFSYIFNTIFSVQCKPYHLKHDTWWWKSLDRNNIVCEDEENPLTNDKVITEIQNFNAKW